MGTKKTNNKMGRPLINIDKEIFEKLCHMQCTQEEIAAFFSCNIDTLCDWCKREYDMTFSDTFQQKRKGGHISLRRKQWNLVDNSYAMAIWLGKQYLGQTDSGPVDQQDTKLELTIKRGKEPTQQTTTNKPTIDLDDWSDWEEEE